MIKVAVSGLCIFMCFLQVEDECGVRNNGGIDFCMTALFVIIFIDNWEKTKNHVPAVLGLIISMLCLIIAGARSFMLPSLILVSGVLLLMREKEAQS